MRPALTALLLALAACGAPVDRPRCGGPGACARGSYCAPEGVCWPDAAAPAIQSVEVVSPLPASRDGQLTVRVQASDDHGVAAVFLNLDLQPGLWPAATFDGTAWSYTYDLAAIPFPDFERAVEVTALVLDEAENQVVQVAATRPVVTRLKWVFDAGAFMSPAAVASDGGAIVGLAKSTNQVLKVSDTGEKVWEATAGTLAVAAAPSIGDAFVSAGNEDGRAFLLGSDGVPLSATGCDTGGAIRASAAMTSDGAIAVFGSDAGSVVAVDGVGRCTPSSAGEAIRTSPVLSRASALHPASASFLRKLEFAAVGFKEIWTGIPPAAAPPSLGLDLDLPLAIDAADRVWSLSTDGKLNATTSAGVSTTVKVLTGPPQGGPVILADGSVVVGDAANRVHRISAAGADLWSSPPDLGGAPRTALALEGGGDLLLVPTARGGLHAVRRSDGGLAWSGQLTNGVAGLLPGNLYTPPGASLSLAYFPSSSGKLYAVVVDGRLDTAAPWPKVFHDTRNTNNAAAPLP